MSDPRQMEPSEVVEARLSDDSTTWRLVVSSPEDTENTRDFSIQLRGAALLPLTAASGTTYGPDVFFECSAMRL